MKAEVEKIIADWQKTYINAETFFTDCGFISYIIMDHAAFIANFFVEEARRHNGEGAILFNCFKNFIVAEYPEIKYIGGDVQLNLPNVTEKARKFISYGGEITSVTPNTITFTYSIKAKK